MAIKLENVEDEDMMCGTLIDLIEEYVESIKQASLAAGSRALEHIPHCSLFRAAQRQTISVFLFTILELIQELPLIFASDPSNQQNSFEKVARIIGQVV